ncbi:MAG: hypothetical protein HON56_05630 [Nitrospina sp.]|jgi:hypothetical protein|nr:hypothetical protein [Nitrospina sp.]
MIRIGLTLIFLLSVGCSEDRKFEDFANEDSGKGEQEFRADSKKCMAEKDKFSHKIQGREFGFEGEHAGYLGCMKLKGWTTSRGG